MIRVERARAPMPAGVLAIGCQQDGAGVAVVRPDAPAELVAAVVRSMAGGPGQAAPTRP